MVIWLHNYTSRFNVGVVLKCIQIALVHALVPDKFWDIFKILDHTKIHMWLEGRILMGAKM